MLEAHGAPRDGRAASPGSRPARAAGRAGAAAAAVAGVLWLWHRFNSPSATPGNVFPFDLVHYYVPMLDLAARRMAAGELPLWNPHACCGIPLLATLQVGVFYPGTWLALAWPAESALALRMGVEVALAALLSAALFRAWGHGVLASLCGAWSFCFACVIGHGFWPSALSTLAWAPGVLLGLDRLLATGRARWGVLLTLALALQLVAGFPQYVLYTGYLAAALGAARLLETARASGGDASRAVRRAGAAGVAVALGLGLAAVQLLPTAELVGESVRGESLAPHEIQYRTEEDALTVAGFVRNAFDPSPKLVTPGYGPGGGYLGAACLLLLGPGLAVGLRRPRGVALAVLGGLTLLLSDGHRGIGAPLFELYASLPGGALFRDPERLRWVTLFCAIGLALPGIDALADGFGELRGRRRRAGVALGLALAAALAALGGVAGALRAGAVLGLAATATRTSRAGRRVVALAFALLALGDLAWGLRPGDGSFWHVPGALSRSLHAGGRTLVDGDRYAALHREVGLGRIAFPNLRPVPGARPVADALAVSCLEPLAPAGLHELHRLLSGALPRAGTLHGLPLARTRGIYDLAGVSRIVLAQASGREPGITVLPNPDALPRAFLVRGLVSADRTETLEALASGRLDPRRAVWLEPEAALDAGLGPESPRADVADGGEDLGHASLASHAPEQVEVAYESSAEAWLVLSDGYFPGWRAEIDGRAAPIHRADALFRAVRVPAGRHRVRFAYEPASLRWGARISLASAALGLVVLGAGAIRARRARARVPQRTVEASTSWAP